MKNLYIVNHFHLLSNKKYEYGVYALLLLSVVNKLKEIRLIHNTLQSTVHILHSVRDYEYNCTSTTVQVYSSLYMRVAFIEAEGHALTFNINFQ